MMKLAANVFTGLLLVHCSHAVQICADVAAHYKQRQAAEGRAMQLQLDINADGRQDKLVYFNYRDACPEGQSGDKRKLCDLYVAAADGKGFVYNRQLEFDDELGEEGLGSFALDTELLYVGKVEELGQTALLALDEFEQDGQSSVIVWAFIWKGQHLKQQKLAQFPAGSQQHRQWQQRYFADKRLKSSPREL